MVTIQSFNFPQAYQYLTLEAGEFGTVWYMPVGGGFVAFVQQVYIRWFTDTVLEFVIDGVPVELTVEHYMGLVTGQRSYNPPLVARQFIRVVAHNNSDVKHTFEATIDGEMCKPR